MAVRSNFTYRFALVSAVVTIVVTASLSSLASAAVRASAVDREARQVADQTNRLLSQSFTREDFTRGVSAEKRARLDALSSGPGNGNMLRVLLWSRDGTLVYSNDHNGVGRRMPVSAGLRAAIGGSTAILPLDPDRLQPFSAETMYLSVEGYLEYLLFQRNGAWVRPGGQAAPRQITPASIAKAAELGVARMFLPVRLDEASAPVGAFEVYYDFRPLERKLNQMRTTVWATIPGGFFALYCSLLVVVQRTSHVLTRQREDLRLAHLGTFHALASAVDARDSDTGDHSGRVASYAVATARRLGLGPEAIADLKIAAELHDIGKIGVPDTVLMKPGPLTSSEWELMRQHAIIGSSILHSTPLSDAIKRAVRHVHERWDGRGYPDQLRGEAIPLLARILAVADAFEAMTSDRPYRRALSPARALSELQRMRGVQFDPTVVDALRAVVNGPDRLGGETQVPPDQPLASSSPPSRNQSCSFQGPSPREATSSR